MSDISLTSKTEVVPFPFSDQAMKLIQLKLASAETEASKLTMLLADDESLMSHVDVQLTNDNTLLSDSDALMEANNKLKCNIISPVLADFPESDTSQSDVVLRLCQLEGVISTLRDSVSRLARERDHWKREKLSSDERFTHASDSFKTEITSLRKDTENDHVKAIEAKEKAEHTAEQLQHDLLQSVDALVSIIYVIYLFIYIH